MKPTRHEGDFSHSLADLMSGLAVMFLIIAAIFMVQSARDKQRAREAQLRAEELAKKNKSAADELARVTEQGVDAIHQLDNLRARLEGNAQLKGMIEIDYHPDVDPRLLTIVFSRDSLQFQSGECDVDAGRRKAVRRSLGEIFPLICDTVGKGVVQSISLEGHTDNEPPQGAKCGMVEDFGCRARHSAVECERRALENNVRLSAARAQYVFFEARDVLAGDAALIDCLDKKFVVAGRGPMDPVDGKDPALPQTDDEKKQNRRVVIRVRVVAGTVPDGVR